MLNGTYYLRQVIYAVQNSESPEGTVGDAVNTYGNITFDGKGNYSFSGSYFDALNSTSPTQFTSNGTYVISASGMGYITAMNPEVSATDLIIGLVSPKGIFIGSSTQNTPAAATGDLGYNDLVIAAPVGSEATNATLKGSYTVAYMDPTFSVLNGPPGGDALFTMTADGQGNIGNVNVTSYISDSTSASTYTLSGATYAFTNGAAQLNLGTNKTALVQGTELLYISPDGNFIFGGAANAADMFVGVRNATSSPANYNGLYYQAGIDISGGIDSYYGSIDAFDCTVQDPCPTGFSGHIIGHQRQNAGSVCYWYYGNCPFDYTYHDLYTLNNNGSSTDNEFSQTYWSSADGTIRIGYGVPSTGFNVLGLNVALKAPAFNGSGVYLNPTGMLNAASTSPFTAELSPGEYISLHGTNLAPSAASATSFPLRDNLNGVRVMINDRAAPIGYVSPTQINVVVPYATESIAQIQVINNGKVSNTVTQFVGTDSAGVFTYDPVGGIGYAAALHSDYSLVTEANPAQIGETISVYLAGMGTVSPAVADGVAPTGPTATDPPVVYIDDPVNSTLATVTYSGLATGYPGLYQINFTIPTGVAAGTTSLAVLGANSDAVEALFPVGTPADDTTPAARAKPGQHLLLHHHRLALRTRRPATTEALALDPEASHARIGSEFHPPPARDVGLLMTTSGLPDLTRDQGEPPDPDLAANGSTSSLR